MKTSSFARAKPASSRPSGGAPRVAKDPDLLGLQLVERHLRVLE